MVKFVVPKRTITNNYKVYFDKQSGDILSVSNSRRTKEGEYFDATFEEVKHLLDDSERIVDWKAVYNTRKFGYDIVNKVNPSVALEINDFIYEIKQSNNAQITVVQNCKQSLWTVQIAKKLKDVLKEKGARLEEILFFSVTSKSNPNVLLRTFQCSLADLVAQESISFEFKSKKELDKNSISVYTNRKFEFYSREVIL